MLYLQIKYWPLDIGYMVSAKYWLKYLAIGKYWLKCRSSAKYWLYENIGIGIGGLYLDTNISHISI